MNVTEEMLMLKTCRFEFNIQSNRFIDATPNIYNKHYSFHNYLFKALYRFNSLVKLNIFYVRTHIERLTVDAIVWTGHWTQLTMRTCAKTSIDSFST